MPENEPDERGIDLAAMAYLGAILGGKTRDEAKQGAESMLEFFGFEKDDATRKSGK